MLGGVRLQRLPVGRHQGAGLRTYLLEYASFFLRATWALARSYARRRYTIVQVATLPDFLVFCALPIKVLGVPILLDLHEAMPEFFRSRFPRAGGPLASRLLLFVERLAIGAADTALTVNEALAERLRALGVPASKVSVVLNSPDLRRFDPAAHERRAFMTDGMLRLVYAGALTPIYELEVCLEALAQLRKARAQLAVRLDIYGRGDAEAALRARAETLGLGDRVRFHGRIPLEAVPPAIAASDVGLAPTREDPFTRLSLSTKLLEYAALEKPVIASRLPTVERYFPADTVSTYRSGDPGDLAAALLRLVDDPEEREARVERTARRVRELAWEHEGARYLALLDRLTARLR